MACHHMITDPPYEAFMHNAKKAKKNKRPLRSDGGAELKPLDFDSIETLRGAVVNLADKVCAGWFLTFCTSEGICKWADEINRSPLRYKGACHWIKPDATPQMNGQRPASGAEHFVCAWAGEGVSKWNGGGKRGVYTHMTNPRSRDGRHPTEKPIALMVELIKDFTMPGDVILDPFMGSGSTGVAALRLGRQFIGIEKDPKYFQIAEERLKAEKLQADLFTGVRFKKAKQEKFEL